RHEEERRRLPAEGSLRRAAVQRDASRDRPGGPDLLVREDQDQEQGWAGRGEVEAGLAVASRRGRTQNAEPAVGGHPGARHELRRQRRQDWSRQTRTDRDGEVRAGQEGGEGGVLAFRERRLRLARR